IVIAPPDFKLAEVTLVVETVLTSRENDHPTYFGFFAQRECDRSGGTSIFDRIETRPLPGIHLPIPQEIQRSTELEIGISRQAYSREERPVEQVFFQRH